MIRPARVVSPDLTALDAGIRDYVRVLQDGGVETYESCEGGPGHCFPEPTVRFHGHRAEGLRAFAWADTHGLPVVSLRRFWTVYRGELEGPHWEMTFSRKSDA